MFCQAGEEQGKEHTVEGGAGECTERGQGEAWRRLDRCVGKAPADSSDLENGDRAAAREASPAMINH